MPAASGRGQTRGAVKMVGSGPAAQRNFESQTRETRSRTRGERMKGLFIINLPRCVDMPRDEVGEREKKKEKKRWFLVVVLF